jgi:hypothetical protein
MCAQHLIEKPTGRVGSGTAAMGYMPRHPPDQYVVADYNPLIDSAWERRRT